MENDRWWVLVHTPKGPVLVHSTNEDQGPSRREGPLEIIDRHADPLPEKEKPD